jgi:hypothetical protein
MKKLLTLFALLAVFMGMKAEWVEDYRIDYSAQTGFPFYVMGYVPEWYDGVMTDFGANYKYVKVSEDAEETSDVIVTAYGVDYYKISLSEPQWHQYFIADGISTEIGDYNRAIKAHNSLMARLKKLLNSVSKWLTEKKEEIKKEAVRMEKYKCLV